MTENDQMVKPEIMLKIFKETVSVFDKYIGDYWIDSGTLLGIIRDDSFIPWEHDIDMATWSDNINNDVRKKVLKAMKDKKLRGYFKADKATFREEGVKVDIWFLDKVGDMATRTTIIPTSRFFQRVNKVSLIFAGLPYNVTHYLYRILRWMVQLSNCERTKMAIPQKYLLATKNYNFKGIEIKIPENVEDYLRFRYGDAWKIPKKDWDHQAEDGRFQ